MLRNFCEIDCFPNNNNSKWIRICKVGNPGKILQNDEKCLNVFFLKSLDEQILNNNYLHYYLKKNETKLLELVKGNHIKTLNKSDLCNFIIDIPSIPSIIKQSPENILRRLNHEFLLFY